MTRMVFLHDLNEELEFVEEAAKQFGDNCSLTTKGKITPGSLFAVRWGLHNRAILVFRIAEDCEPTIYADVIKMRPEQGKKEKE